MDLILRGIICALVVYGAYMLIGDFLHWLFDPRD